ncbi:MAG: hypothetical protein QM736_29335 [Vicinamibacterales bacterium]
MSKKYREHVHVALIGDRRHLDAGHERDSARGTRVPSGVAAGDGVVIGEAENRDTSSRRTVHQFLRRALAVGCGGVRVQIDQCGVADDSGF